MRVAGYLSVLEENRGTAETINTDIFHILDSPNLQPLRIDMLIYFVTRPSVT